MEELGFIGLGSMGAPMAARLLQAGHRLAVYARRADATGPLVSAGGVVVASLKEVAAQSDVVFTMVTDATAVEAVALGDDGLIDAVRPGSVVVDHSTISPAVSRRIASMFSARGADMLDAPVSGGVAGARAGSLSIMVGGDERAFERCRPLLAHLGKTITYIGSAGAGQVAKACNQICIIVNQLGVAEAALVAERSGVDFERLRGALMGGFAASRILEIQGPKMAARRFDGEIESRLHHKDALIVLEIAKTLGVSLPASALAAALLAKLQEAGGAKLDSAAVFTILERLSRRSDKI